MVTLVLERVKEAERKNRERLYDESEDVRRSREGRCTRDSVKPDVELRTKKCTRKKYPAPHSRVNQAPLMVVFISPSGPTDQIRRQ